MAVSAFNRTLEQELNALLRGVSLECLVCGEFVQHLAEAITCSECGSELRGKAGEAGLQLTVQAG